MALIEVDRLDLEASQAVLDGSRHVRATEALAVGAAPHLAPHLRRQNDVAAVAPLLHPATDDLFRDATGVPGRPAAVDVSRIDEVAARRHEGVHDFD